MVQKCSGFQLVIDNSVLCVCCFGSLVMLGLVVVLHDLCMCNRFWTWKMTCGSKKRASAAFVCDGVLLPCGHSRHVKLSDSPSCGAFSTSLPVAVKLIGCRSFALGKTYELTCDRDQSLPKFAVERAAEERKGKAKTQRFVCVVKKQDCLSKKKMIELRKTLPRASCVSMR